MKAKNQCVLAFAFAMSACASESKQPSDGLQFDPNRATQQSLTMPNGKLVNYTAYENLYYVTSCGRFCLSVS